MFYKEAPNFPQTVFILENTQGNKVYLRTRISPCTNVVDFCYNIGTKESPLFEVQSWCHVQFLSKHLKEKYPDYKFL